MSFAYSPEVKAAVTEDTARWWAINGNAEQKRRALSLIRRKPDQFVKEVIAECRGRCVAVEAGIQDDPYWACIYAKEVIGDRFVAAEPRIAMNPVNSCKYAEEVLRGEFELGEKTIATSAAATVRYATFLRKRFPPGEEVVLQDRKHTDEYFRIVVRTPDKSLEQVLSISPEQRVSTHNSC